MIRMKNIALSLLVSTLCFAASSGADDTEIFFAKTNGAGDEASKVLFMFDTSGSMKIDDGLDLTRIDRLKRAMVDLIDSGVNTKIGIGVFNGKERGGAILVPPVSLNEDRCIDQACDEIKVRASIASSEDDAHEDATGKVDLNFRKLVMAQYEPESRTTTKYFKVENANDDAMEFPDGRFDLSSNTLMLSGDDPDNAPAFGVRFNNVDIDEDAFIKSAELIFAVPKPSTTNGVKHALIRVDGTEDSPPFDDSDGKRVLDRPYLPEAVEWIKVEKKYKEDETVVSTDISKLLQAKIKHPDWDDGDGMAFIVEHWGDIPVNEKNRRAFKSYENGFKAGVETRLKVVYSTNTVPSQTVGLRFTNLNIPRGAIIENATIGFNTESPSSVVTNLEISGHATGNAETFTNATNNLSGRPKTTARVDWNPETWSHVDWPATSSDISPVIQELVNRSDWCGGNAMALLINGKGKRSAKPFDTHPWSAPVLDISYKPGSVDFNDTCLSQTARARIRNPVDDIQEFISTGEIDTGAEMIQTSDTNGPNMLGFRFKGLEVPQGAKIVDAHLRLIAAESESSLANAKIYGDDTVFSAVFNGNFDNDASLRMPTMASVAWNNIGETISGTGIKSPNLAAIVEEIVAKPGWLPGNPMTLLIEGDGSSGSRSFKTLDGDGAATLIVSYQLDESSLAGESVPLRTGRDDLLSAILAMEPIASTQLMDAYYEAAAYMTGKAVEFGRQRGHGLLLDRFYRISSPDTYTGGQVYRPPLCSESNLNSAACVSERIDLAPVYNPAPPTSCGTDQIVLLSDGEATKNNAQALVQSMTNNVSCETRSNEAEICGVELSEWLSVTDHYPNMDDTQSIITHTVGFNFSSSFLKDIAARSGGGFHTANTSSELVEVFSTIIANTADANTTFVAPTTSVSQSNRLANSNDLYFGLFHPSNSDKWDGNLKKYQLAKSPDDPNQIVVVGADGNPAFDPTTGAISSQARSFWSEQVDGAEVTKGGAASQLRLSRDLLTYTDTTQGQIVLEPLHESNANISAALLNIDPSAPDYRDILLRWSRGVDVKDSDKDGNTTEVRTQIGDPLHSSPTVLNYPDRSLIFMGTNEGFLHAIDTLSGAEEFAFIPRSLLGNLSYHFNDEPSTDRVYGLDGPITAWFNDENNNNIVDADAGENAYIVIGMRRGGRDYYALDVTDPANPSVAWIIEGGSGDFGELGQTWSKPIHTQVNVYGTPREVLIFAAGYDVKNDEKRVRDKTDSMGRGIFIVDALTGQRLAYQAPIDQTDLYYSIPSTVRAIDINLDELSDTIFVGDTGGQLWRFDIDNSTTGDLSGAISGGVIADLGGSSISDNRRFYSEPDIALTSDSEHGEFLTIAIGSGFRAHPLDVEVKDQFYVLRDYAVFAPPRNESDEITYTSLTTDQLFDATTKSGKGHDKDELKNGWFLNLTDNGEKSMSKAITVNQQILFTTYLPETGDVGICNVKLGRGRVYAVDSLFGGAVANLDAGDSDSDQQDDESQDNLSIADRSRDLISPGIPPPVTALLPEASPESPVLLAGPEAIPAIDFGRLFRRTYWAEH